MDEALTMAEKLKKDIKNAAIKRGINPYKESFKPSDLGLTASDYGSFSDHCEKGTTKSSKWCGCGLLQCVNINKRPFKYILIK